jgi:hypothetical protein
MSDPALLKPSDSRAGGFDESRCCPSGKSFTEGTSGLDEKEEDTAIPNVFDRNSIQEIGRFQFLVLKRAYPWLNRDELVDDETQRQRLSMGCEPGCSTTLAPATLLHQVPVAPMHEALEQKMSAIISHYLAKTKGSTRGVLPPSLSKLASLTKPHSDLYKLVGFKKSVASRVQCNLAPSDAELLLLEAYAPDKVKVLDTVIPEKMAKAKSDALGVILGASNGVQILTEFANSALKEQPPDITAAHTALGIISRMNVHGVADSVFRLQTAAVWERRKAVLDKTSKIPQHQGL